MLERCQREVKMSGWKTRYDSVWRKDVFDTHPKYTSTERKP